MIDVHPPHGKLHGFGDFLLHLFTITIGLVIALGLEGLVELHHHHVLVREARANLESEFRDNSREMSDALNDIHREQAEVKGDLRSLETMESNPKAHGMSVGFHVSNTRLQHASWDTAQEVGALSWMPYPEVKSYAELIDLESQFNEHEDRVMNAYTQAISFLDRFNEGVPGQTISEAAPDAIRISLDIQSELMLCENIAQELQKRYTEILRASQPS